jgi:hypothetical protein
MKSKYRPEIDVSPVLSDSMASYCQGLIGVLRWICELGIIDILKEVLMLSSHNALPRKGHLEAVLDIFAYLKRHPSAATVFDNGAPIVRESRFKKVDWSDIYRIERKPAPPHVHSTTWPSTL